MKDDAGQPTADGNGGSSDGARVGCGAAVDTRVDGLPLAKGPASGSTGWSNCRPPHPSMKPYYEDSSVTIYCGRWEDVGLPACDLVITDPPYNAINRATGGLRSIDKGAADSEPVDLPSLVAALAATDAHTVYGWCSSEQLGEWWTALQGHGFTTRTGVWWKSNPSPMNGEHLWLPAVEVCAFGRRANATFTRHCEAPVWRGPVAEANGHPTPKPVWLMQSLVRASSNPGDLILDPFAGGGSTLYAAKQMNRRAVGIEMNERYCEIAASRLSQNVLDLGAA